MKLFKIQTQSTKQVVNLFTKFMGFIKKKIKLQFFLNFTETTHQTSSCLQIIFIFIFFNRHSQSVIKKSRVIEEKSQIKNKSIQGGSSSGIQFRLQLVQQIAEGIQSFHKQKISHGALTPRNIYLSNSYNIKIVDFLFMGLKKYFGLTSGYTNKSQYSAPEQLQEKGNVSSGFTQKADIYALGMIIYEIFTEQRPFNNLSIKEITQLVVNQQKRPNVQNIQANIAEIIRACWQTQPNLRPDIDSVVDALNSINDEGNTSSDFFYSAIQE